MGYPRRCHCGRRIVHRRRAARKLRGSQHHPPKTIEVVGSYREDHGPWAYTTVFAFEKPGHTVEPKANDDESMEICWVPIDDVPNRKLLTAMKTDWPRFAARLDELACAGHR